MSDKITLNIDASSLKSSTCLLEWYNTVVRGYTSPVSGASMVYGSGLHKYIHVMFQSRGDIKLAREEALKVFRQPKVDKPKQQWLSDERHFLATCYMYWDDCIVADKTYNVIELDGNPATERTFSIPYCESDNVKVNLCGTIDSIGKIAGGIYCIRDFKTTASWQTETYTDNYEMSAQLRFYVLALQLMHEKYPDTVLGKLGAEKLGARIDAIFLKSKPSENKYESSEVFPFSELDMLEFRVNLDRQINRLVEVVDQNIVPAREGIVNGSCSKQYGMRCSFWQCCKQTDERIRALLYQRDFKIRQYEPINFGKV